MFRFVRKRSENPRIRPPNRREIVRAYLDDLRIPLVAMRGELINIWFEEPYLKPYSEGKNCVESYAACVESYVRCVKLINKTEAVCEASFIAEENFLSRLALFLKEERSVVTTEDLFSQAGLLEHQKRDIRLLILKRKHFLEDDLYPTRDHLGEQLQELEQRQEGIAAFASGRKVYLAEDGPAMGQTTADQQKSTPDNNHKHTRRTSR